MIDAVGVIEGVTETVDVLEGVAPIEREGVGVDEGVGVPVFEFETVGDGVLLAVGVFVVVGEAESVPVTDGVAEGCAPGDSDAVGVGVPEGVAGTPPTEPVAETEGVLVGEADMEKDLLDVTEMVGDAVEPVETDGVGVPDEVAVFEGVAEADAAWHTPPVGGTPASEPDDVKARLLEVARTAPRVVWFLIVIKWTPVAFPATPVPSCTV